MKYSSKLDCNKPVFLRFWMISFMVMCLFFQPLILDAQTDDYIINYLTVKDGLSQNEVTSVCRDKFGFMWFGTRGGLNRYDGYEFKHFKPTRDRENSIQNPSVERLFVGAEGHIWVGTKSGGVSVYDPSQETFNHLTEFLDPSQDRIISFLEDNEGIIWMGSWEGGLISYNTENKSFKHYFSGEKVSSIIQSKDGTIWCGTNDGLKYIKKGNDFECFTFGKNKPEIVEIVEDPDGPYLWLVGWEVQLIRFNYTDFTFQVFELPQKENQITNTYSLLIDKTKRLWVGTWGGGLYLFDKISERFQKVDIKPKFDLNQTSNFDIILDIYQDNEDALWIGTDGGGVVRLSFSSQFNTITSFADKSNLHLTAVYKDSNDNLLVGTRGNGLFISRDGQRFKSVDVSKFDLISHIDEMSVWNIYPDNDGNIWICFDAGLFILQNINSASPSLVRASTYFNSPDLQVPKKVLDIIEKGDELWIGTQQKGLFLFKKNDNSFNIKKHFVASGNDGDIENNRISKLLVDHNNKLWVGTYKGLYLYSETDSLFTPVIKLLNESDAPLCSIILCAWLDKNNELWFGTPCSLNRLEEQEDDKYDLIEYTTHDGLADDYISNITEDDEGNIWVSTNTVISRLNKETNNISNFEISDGLGGFNFSESSCFMSGDGTIYLGSSSDLTYFQPNQIRNNKTIPQIVITNLKIMNSEVPISPDGILPESINELDKLNITFHEKEILIEFAALDYKSPGSNQYAYKLERRNEKQDWVYMGSRRNISLRNMKPGNYTLHLRGSNSNGVWNEESRVLQIEVLSPPWKRWYAIITYVFIIILIIGLIIRVSLKQERLENAAKLVQIKREQEKQLNEYKLRFFTNISHEFRTPLTLILAPINELIKKDWSDMNSDVGKKLEIISRNSNRLLNLVNQLLEFRKVEVGKAKMAASKQDIVAFLKDICQSFEELAIHQKIDFKTKYSVSEPNIYFDVAKMNVVINNLLSNAFKYCGEPGKVRLNVSETDAELIIEVLNSGKSISIEDQKHIFDRFYQFSAKYYYNSSGIGLALVKNYVEMHKGNIDVISQEGKPTQFTISLMKGKSHFSPEHISVKKVVMGISEAIIQPSIETDYDLPIHDKDAKVANLIVVEDNVEFRQYLVSYLSKFYNTYGAKDGVVGYEKIIEHKPDVVVSDVMMPEMDGFELCQRIKSNPLISHIPIILLTAKDTSEDELFGTKKGADAYITKPFDPEFLVEKINQILANRKLLEGKYSKTVMLEPQNKEITSEEEKILNAALRIIEENISDKELCLDFLASELAMSSTTLYRKMKSITGSTPGEFIKSIRFKRAAQLFRDTDLTVSEVIEMIGYQDIKRFRESFKAEYGLSPSEYRKQNKEA